MIKIVKELRNKPYVKAIILFGSYARGKYTPLSDIDICRKNKKDCKEQ